MKLVGLTAEIKRSKSRLLHAFLDSCGTDYKLINRDVDNKLEDDPFIDFKFKKDELYVIYGFFGVSKLIHRMILDKANFLFIDNGYTSSKHNLFNTIKKKADFTFSFTINNTRLNHITEATVKKPCFSYRGRKTGGKNIVICIPSKYVANAHGFTVDQWVETAKEKLKHFDRPFVVRTKHDPTPLKDILHESCLVVASQSLSGLEAIVSGVPVISDDFALSAPVSNSIVNTYSNIDDLFYPNKEQFDRWIMTLMSNEFSWGNKSNILETVMKLQHMSLH